MSASGCADRAQLAWAWQREMDFFPPPSSPLPELLSILFAIRCSLHLESLSSHLCFWIFSFLVIWTFMCGPRFTILSFSPFGSVEACISVHSLLQRFWEQKTAASFLHTLPCDFKGLICFRAFRNALISESVSAVRCGFDQFEPSETNRDVRPVQASIDSSRARERFGRWGSLEAQCRNFDYTLKHIDGHFDTLSHSHVFASVWTNVFQNQLWGYSSRKTLASCLAWLGVSEDLFFTQIRIHGGPFRVKAHCYTQTKSRFLVLTSGHRWASYLGSVAPW